MKKRSIFKRIMATFLAASMIASIMPGNITVYAGNETISGSGTNNNITKLRQSISPVTKELTTAFPQEAIVFAITPYFLGSNNASGGNVLNRYIIGAKDGTVFTKNDLIYQTDVEEKDKWGYIVKSAAKVKNGAGVNVYPAAFTEDDNGSYIPNILNSLEVLQGEKGKTNDESITLGEVSVTVNGHEVSLMEDLYPEYKYLYSQEQQYYAQAGSALYNNQSLNKSSLIFISADSLPDAALIFYNSGRVWYAQDQGAALNGKYKEYGFDNATNSGIAIAPSNVIMGQLDKLSDYPYLDVLKGKTGLADPTETDPVAQSYTRFGDKTPASGETLSEMFMRDVVKIDEDRTRGGGGVFYNWLVNTMEIWEGLNSSTPASAEDFTAIHEDKYYWDSESNKFVLDNERNEDPDYTKTSVGPQINYKNLAKVPDAVDKLLAEKADGKPSNLAKSLTKEALTLWQYILYGVKQTNKDSNNQTVSTELGDGISVREKIDDFLRMGIANTLSEYGDELYVPIVDYTAEEPCVTGEGEKITAEKILSLSNSEQLMKCATENGFEFAMNVYNAHYLDLLICAYVCAYNMDPNSYETAAWKELLVKYCNPEDNNWSANGCAIQITPVIMTRCYIGPGDDPSLTTVYASVQDYAMLIYNIEEAGSLTEDSELSLNKAFFGYDSDITSSSVINPDTIITSVDINENTPDGLWGSGGWTYERFYRRLPATLQKNLDAGKDITSYNTAWDSKWFGSPTISKFVFKYLYEVDTKTNTIKEVASNNDWAGKDGGNMATLVLGTSTSYGGTREPFSKLNPSQTMGNNLIVAYQWENLYQIAKIGQDDLSVKFIKEDDTADPYTMTIDLNSKEESSDYKIENKDGEIVVQFGTSTSAKSDVVQDKDKKKIEALNLSLGTKVYISEIRVNGEKADTDTFNKLVAKNGGLKIEGAALDKGGRAFEAVNDESVLHNYLRKGNGSLISSTDWDNEDFWITKATPNLTREEAESDTTLGAYYDDIEFINEVLSGKKSVDVPMEELHLSFGDNFLDSTMYEIDILYKRSAALGGTYGEEEVENVFDRAGSNSIKLTLQYTPSESEYKIIGYVEDDGYILALGDGPGDLTIGLENKIVFENGKITFPYSPYGEDLSEVTFTVAEPAELPATLIYSSSGVPTNYNDMCKSATSKTEVKVEVVDGNIEYTFTPEKASNYTYLMIPLDDYPLDTFMEAATLYYDINSGRVIYAEPSSLMKDSFKAEVTGIDGILYSTITDERLLETYGYDCLNPSADYDLLKKIFTTLLLSNSVDIKDLPESLLSNFSDEDIKNFDFLTYYGDAETSSKNGLSFVISHEINSVIYEYVVTGNVDKVEIFVTVYVPVESHDASDEVPVQIYYVDQNNPEKVLKKATGKSAQKGQSYKTTVLTQWDEGLLSYTVESSSAYYVNENGNAKNLQSYASAKLCKPITGVSLNDDLVTIGTIPNDATSIAIYLPVSWSEKKVTEAYISKPDAYAELKEGSVWYDETSNKNIFEETFEAMAGVPSTETLYFSTGGSEFIVQLAIESVRETAVRTYESHFNEVLCQFAKSDTFNGGTTGTVVTKEFIEVYTSATNVWGSYGDVESEFYNMVDPEGASSYNTTYSGHNSHSNAITAKWTGTITNDTSDPGITNNKDPEDKIVSDGTHYSGKPGKMNPTGQETAGGSYVWGVDDYNTALENAFNWAKALEDISDEDLGNVYMIANSDGITRSFHLGDAIIDIKFENVNAIGNDQAYHTMGHTASLSNTTVTTETWDTLKLEANDVRLSSGWYEVYGHAEDISGSSCKGPFSYTGQKREDTTITWTDEKEIAEYVPTSETYEFTSDYEWSGSDTSTGATAVKDSIDGETNWCGAAWHNTGSATYSFCGQSYHEHTGSPGSVGGCYGRTCGMSEHTHTSSCTGDDKSCSKTEHSHSSGCVSMTCTKNVHVHSSGCLNTTPFTASQTGHVCTASHSTSGYTLTTTKPAKDIKYTITVTFKDSYTRADGSKYENETVSGATKQVPTGGVLPSHALCGPCCQHILPEIEDTWTQEFEFRTAAITAMKVWRLDSGYVTEMDEITKDSVTEIIATGDIIQNLFYNIASTPTSAAGRIRYSLQTGQDDAVYWEEISKDRAGEPHLYRSNYCDGMKHTLSQYNPYPNGGTGHGEDYAHGCLYTNSEFANGKDLHKIDGDLKTGYSFTTSDERDRKSPDWKRFEMRRNMDVTVTVISDMLIVQSTSGDESICYHDASQKVKAQENPDKLIDVTWSEIYTNNPLIRKGNDKNASAADRTLNVGSYNGLYNLVDSNADKNKYTGLGNGAKIITRFDDNPATTEENDGDMAYYSGKYANLDIKEDGTAVDETTTHVTTVTNKRTVREGTGYISTPGQSQSRLERPATPLLITVDGIEQKVTNPNKEYVPGQSYAFFEEILSYDRDGGFSWYYTSKIDPIIGKYGYTMKSIYTQGKTSVNNIIVHDPVSVVNAKILKPEYADDQRVIVKSNSASLNEMFETMEKCPGNPSECTNRVLSCTFFDEKTLAAFNIDNHTIDDNGYVYINADSGVKVGLDGSGYAISTANEDSYLYTNDEAELNINWAKLSLDMSSPLTSVAISADIKLSSLNETIIFETQNVTLKTLGNGQLQLKFATGDTYESNQSFGNEMNICLIISNGALTINTNYVLVDGNKVDFEKTSSGTIKASSPYLGNYVRVGKANVNDSMSAPSQVDNLVIKKMAGTKNHTDACYTNVFGELKLTCDDPHHTTDALGNPVHYGYSSKICYQACNNDSLHQESANATDSTGQALELANYIFLDNYFQVYFANKGNFADDPTLNGILDTTDTRGKGYENDMDTTKWLREKWIMFTFATLYYRESTGEWEQHKAGEYFRLDRDYEYYNFYCLLKNDERSGAIVEFVSEAINNVDMFDENGERIKTQDCPSVNGWETNKTRFDEDSNFSAYHSAFKKNYIDVVGRIGNLIVEDTDDIRFTNLYKKTKDGESWYIDGLVEKVDSSIQKNFSTWLSGIDIRGSKLIERIGQGIGFNTYGTLPWATGNETYTSANDYTAGVSSLPISSDKNPVQSLVSENLKLGYKILWDISTIGNYGSGNVEVKPYVFALNIKTGVLTPVDVYMDMDEGYLPINFFGLYEEDEATQKELLSKLGNYAIYLDWTKSEQERRNYSLEEQRATASVQSALKTPLVDAEGNVVTLEIVHPASDYQEIYDEDEGVYILVNESTPEWVEEVVQYRELQIPSGKYNVLGNLQLLSAGESARTFIGTSQVNGVFINDKEETELINNVSEQWRYNKQGQRWHMYLGLPSNSVFVPFTDGIHYDPYTVKTDEKGENYFIKDEIKADDEDYVFLLTMDITAFGDIYSVHYEQDSNGSFKTTNNEGGTVTWKEYNNVLTMDNYTLDGLNTKNADGSIKTPYKFIETAERDANGNIVRWNLDDLPTLLAVYQGKSTEDLDINQTH